LGVIGYLRVSTIEQDNEKFKSEILHYANAHKMGTVQWVEEKISGTKDWKKRALGQLLIQSHSGDCIIVSELSRLARSIKAIYDIIEFCQSKHIDLHVLKQQLIIQQELNITTKVMINTFAMVAELERDFISLRTKEALQNRKRQGYSLGRPKGSSSSKLDAFSDEILSMVSQGVTKKKIAAKYNITYQALYNWMKVQDQSGPRISTAE